MKKYYSVILMICIVQTIHGQFTWTNKNAFAGLGRNTAAGFSINGTGYIVGGYTAYPNGLVNEVWAYNAANDTWTQKANFPLVVAGSIYFSIGDSAYVCGGVLGGGSYSGANYLYNPASDTWTPKASFPDGVGGTFQFVINGIGYAGAGARTGAINSATFYSYNPGSDVWTQLPNFPGPGIISSVGFAIDSLGYAGLGSDGNNNLSSAFYKYSPATNSWSPVAPFPGELRSSAMAFVINGKAYVGGGWSLIPGNTSIIFDCGDFFEYDPTADTWTPVPGLPGRGRQYGCAFEINNSGYIVSGYDDYITAAVTTVSEFGECNKITTGITPTTGNTKALIEIYPNPSTSDVTVKISNTLTSKLKYEIVSVDGKLVKSGSTTQSTFGFSTNNLSNGMYILTITDDKGLRGEKHFEVIH